MEFEDSRNALFCEPNAYIQKCDSEVCHPKKVIFQEPYENLPNFYLDNNFKKGQCDCIPKKHHIREEEKHSAPPPKSNTPNFDLKSMLPLLSGLLGKGGGGNMTNLISMLGNNTQTETGLNGGFNMQNIISTLTSNPEMMTGVLKMFKGGGLGGLFQKKSSPKVEMKSSDICIKNYTRVD